jgi:predicted GNAT family acetyltransferase
MIDYMDASEPCAMRQSDMDFVIERLATAEEFLRRTESFQHLHPMETNIIGSIATSVANRSKTYSETFWWVISQGSDVVGIAMRTAPYRLVLSPMPREAIHKLSLAVLDTDPGFWGVSGPEECATEFVKCWCEKTGRKSSEFPQHMRETIYVLGDHTRLSKVSGNARKAASDDVDLLRKWLTAFAEEVGILFTQPTEAELLARLASTPMFIWEADGRPVAMSGHAPLVSGPTGHIGRIGPVFTEPSERGHGYGAAVTSAVIDHLHSIGCSTVMLYADSDYEKSNRVYQGLGFRPVGAIVELGVATSS